MNNILYYPILKWKTGEQCALSKRNFNTQNFLPIIELVDETEPFTFFNSVASCYNGPIIYDTARCDQDRVLLSSYAAYAQEHHIEAYPLLYPNDIYDQFETISKMTSKVSVKIPIPEDIDGESTQDILNSLVPYSSDTLIDLIFDAGEVLTPQIANIVFATYKDLLINNETLINKFKNLVVCLTSFPEQPTIDSGESTSYIRYDIQIFSKLCSYFPTYKLSYSDYGVTKFTESELDFRLMKYGTLPKIKYTTYDKYYIHKGKKDRIHGIYTRSIKDMCKEIIKSPYYSGQEFSYGDQIIYEKATLPTAGPGNSPQWVTYCANHHLTLVMEQLSNLSSV